MGQLIFVAGLRHSRSRSAEIQMAQESDPGHACRALIQSRVAARADTWRYALVSRSNTRFDATIPPAILWGQTHGSALVWLGRMVMHARIAPHGELARASIASRWFSCPIWRRVCSHPSRYGRRRSTKSCATATL